MRCRAATGGCIRRFRVIITALTRPFDASDGDTGSHSSQSSRRKPAGRLMTMTIPPVANCAPQRKEYQTGYAKRSQPHLIPVPFSASVSPGLRSGSHTIRSVPSEEPLPARAAAKRRPPTGLSEGTLSGPSLGRPGSPRPRGRRDAGGVGDVELTEMGHRFPALPGAPFHQLLPGQRRPTIGWAPPAQPGPLPAPLISTPRSSRRGIPASCQRAWVRHRARGRICRRGLHSDCPWQGPCPDLSGCHLVR